MVQTPITHKSSKVIFQSPWMKLRVDQIQFLDGTEGEYGVIEKNNSVLVIPVQGEKLMLVQQYRYPIAHWTWEFPQGELHQDESVEDAAKRELREETGCMFKELETLNYMYEAAGFATHGFHIVVARVSDTVVAQPEHSEMGISGRWFDLVTLKKMASSGELKDSPTVAALFLYLLHFGVKL